MKAKDKVIPIPDRLKQEIVARLYQGSEMILGDNDILIAEISFKAGIREVAEWIKLNEPDIYASLKDWSRWQAFLKSKGIE